MKQSEATVKASRRIGLGTMGLAHMLVRVGVQYDSKDSVQLANLRKSGALSPLPCQLSPVRGNAFLDLGFPDEQRTLDRGVRLSKVWWQDSLDQATGRRCTEWVRG